MRLTENPTLYTTQFAWLALLSHEISADSQWPLGSEGMCDFSHHSVFVIRQYFCTSLKVACSGSRLFYTTTARHRPSASDCQKKNALEIFRCSSGYTATWNWEKRNRMWGRGIVRKNRAVFSYCCSTLSREKSKTDVLYHLLMKNG